MEESPAPSGPPVPKVWWDPVHWEWDFGAVVVLSLGGLTYLIGRLALRAELSLLPIPIDMESAGNVEQVASTVALMLFEAMLGLSLLAGPIVLIQRWRTARRLRRAWWEHAQPKMPGGNAYLVTTLVFSAGCLWIASVGLPLKEADGNVFLGRWLLDDAYFVGRLAVFGAASAVLIGLASRLWQLRVDGTNHHEKLATLALIMALLFSIGSMYGRMIKDHNWQEVKVVREGVVEEHGLVVAQSDKALALLVHDDCRVWVKVLAWRRIRSLEQQDALDLYKWFRFWQSSYPWEPQTATLVAVCLSMFVTLFLSPILMPPLEPDTVAQVDQAKVAEIVQEKGVG